MITDNGAEMCSTRQGDTGRLSYPFGIRVEHLEEFGNERTIQGK